MAIVDTAVIGGGQAGLAVGYYLRRAGLEHVVLDDQPGPGGAWRAGWDSLRLFSPARYSSLPGWLMPPARDGDYPTRDETLAYLTAYEARYDIPVLRPWPVSAVTVSPDPEFLEVRGSDGATVLARTVVSATGTWRRPWWPRLPGLERFGGAVLHSAGYRSPEAHDLVGRRVLVVGGGNSGAQILAELSGVADATWATREPPVFLPDEVDGRVLFHEATARYRAREAGTEPPPRRSLGDIVVVPPVRAARDRGVLVPRPMPLTFTPGGARWPGGPEERFDAVVLATGFRPALEHLEALGVVDDRGRVAMEGTRCAVEPRLWLVGYGAWTGFASATLIGVGRSARATVEEIQATLAATGRVP
ncbi:MAG TPA: ArsO family NAD(P)H-dependent flavin-containing monooxygenase [Longimicrobiales bacterium]|nr:ArsO family NAD(P)H-dependent flavin-containing monooxygenase [Longimicrobiales bacterium]